MSVGLELPVFILAVVAVVAIAVWVSLRNRRAPRAPAFPAKVEAAKVDAAKVGVARPQAVRADAVFLAGGSSRLPLATTAPHRAIGVAPTTLERPETVVAEGASS